jgi:uncharacterized surface protein with fasciclin (FAS1) repeats
MFPKSPIADDVEFVHELQKHNVLTVPGRGFGTPGYFRVSYCVSHKTLEGTSITVKGSGQNWTVNGTAKVICGNIPTANATVYLIDTVLQPK